MGNQQKVKMTAFRISFMMEHQKILGELKEMLIELYPSEIEPEKINKESPEYLLGAHDALLSLISALEQKGSQI